MGESPIVGEPDMAESDSRPRSAILALDELILTLGMERNEDRPIFRDDRMQTSYFQKENILQANDYSVPLPVDPAFIERIERNSRCGEMKLCSDFNIVPDF